MKRKVLAALITLSAWFLLSKSWYLSIETLVNDLEMNVPESHGNARTEIVISENDYIYKGGDVAQWDSAPVVVEDYKLVFFTVPKVACTTWKQLFRRMGGAHDWASQDVQKMIPHNPETNGLTYLHHYDLTTANKMMTDPTWTRAIFVRDPKDRFFSAFFDKAKKFPDFLRQKCCASTGDCVETSQTASGFMDLIETCQNPHWNPQAIRMEDKYWKYINFVGRFEHQFEDAKELLERIGAWDDYGATGWGKTGDLAIFQRGSNIQNHVTHSKSKGSDLLTPSLEQRLAQYYEGDYANPKFGFVKSRWNATTS